MFCSFSEYEPLDDAQKAELRTDKFKINPHSHSREKAADKAKPVLKHGRCSVVCESDGESDVDEFNKCAIGRAVDRRDKSRRSKSVAFYHEVTN